MYSLGNTSDKESNGKILDPTSPGRRGSNVGTTHPISLIKEVSETNLSQSVPDYKNSNLSQSAQDDKNRSVSFTDSVKVLGYTKASSVNKTSHATMQRTNSYGRLVDLYGNGKLAYLYWEKKEILQIETKLELLLNSLFTKNTFSIHLYHGRLL